jgi:hypothetical protein
VAGRVCRDADGRGGFVGIEVDGFDQVESVEMVRFRVQSDVLLCRGGKVAALLAGEGTVEELTRRGGCLG